MAKPENQNTSEYAPSWSVCSGSFLSHSGPFGIVLDHSGPFYDIWNHSYGRSMVKPENRKTSEPVPGWSVCSGGFLGHSGPSETVLDNSDLFWDIWNRSYRWPMAKPENHKTSGCVPGWSVCGLQLAVCGLFPPSPQEYCNSC